MLGDVEVDKLKQEMKELGKLVSTKTANNKVLQQELAEVRKDHA